MDNCDLVWVNTMRSRRVTLENQNFFQDQTYLLDAGGNIYVTFGELRPLLRGETTCLWFWKP